ncbi:uncharacterized protein N7483_008161 [Penicillium malachiteum]|uniref:uncharacterized protein n=1 Tax=Penicillium malachiteum TaxID=1324776 RepID=UPI002548AA62|nr:uncharacterized protein N7483_008161 [Penicillium malachiteum]KAJ5720227.1 hypothetical protein N7483_008161 [Penicillium malachiteum]
MKIVWDEDRPYIASSHFNRKFRVGDKVYLLGSDGSRDGPYLVALVISEQECILSLENGQTAKDGEVINMAKLETA